MAGSSPSTSGETVHESPRRDGSRPGATAPGAEPAPGPSEAELERAIVDAVTAGALDVARVLAARLEARRVPAGVIQLRPRR